MENDLSNDSIIVDSLGSGISVKKTKSTGGPVYPINVLQTGSTDVIIRSVQSPFRIE